MTPHCAVARMSVRLGAAVGYTRSRCYSRKIRAMNALQPEQTAMAVEKSTAPGRRYL